MTPSRSHLLHFNSRKFICIQNPNAIEWSTKHPHHGFTVRPKVPSKLMSDQLEHISFGFPFELLVRRDDWYYLGRHMLVPLPDSTLPAFNDLPKGVSATSLSNQIRSAYSCGIALESSYITGHGVLGSSNTSRSRGPAQGR